MKCPFIFLFQKSNNDLSIIQITLEIRILIMNFFLKNKRFNYMNQSLFGQYLRITIDLIVFKK